MVATLCLLGGMLAPLQAPPTQGPVPWLLTPRLARAQELVYRGSYSEEALDNGIRNTRSYDLDTRLFVVEINDQGAEVAFLTTFKLQRRKGELDRPDPGSARLELVHMDPQGRLTARSGASLLVSLTGPSTIDCDAVVEVPRYRVILDQSWEVVEAGRPPRSWMVVGTEDIGGTPCVKLAGLQQSADWSKPRADHTAWRRQDLVWLSARLGVAVRVERTIERREPARQEPTQRFVARYELESALVYPGQLFEDRQREILQYAAFAKAASPLLGEVGKARPETIDAVLMKIKLHSEGQPATPYRPAIERLQRQLEAARKGELALVPGEGPKAESVAVATVGRPAPDFMVPCLIDQGTMVRLHRLLGKPTLLLFYSPDSRFAHEVLRFAQKIHAGNPQGAQVLALAFSDNREAVAAQYKEMNLTLPILAGKGLRTTYGVDATPRLVVIDGDGVVRGAFTGWGPEIPGAVVAELERWLRR